MSNRLSSESSPYLLQHAHNPVDWYPWGSEALERAKAEDKPILVSIGYAACHWCHVMERESFEKEETAAFMNQHFINIKIDREERPDLDHIYMDAVQAMTGSGGWPLNVFLTPDARPFYGGTYFPPSPAFNRASWMQVLQGVVKTFLEKREELESQAENLTSHLKASNSFGIQVDADREKIISREKTIEAFEAAMKMADTEWGGFGRAPKFPQSFTIRFLLRYYYAEGEKDPDSANKARDFALFSLDKMIYGGIYDQFGGGFARYSTDTEWLAPHFEKMLYDNALLLSAMAEAYQITGNSLYRDTISQTMEFINREMLSPENGFYAALDADSEDEEGKFYVWNRGEVEDLLGDDADLFCRFYDISEGGNWEHKSIARVLKPLDMFAKEEGISTVDLGQMLERGRQTLLAARSKRVRPGLDDKIILGWNALMNTACSQIYAATGNQAYLDLAIANMNFILGNFATNGSSDLAHTWKNGKASQPAFLDDYAFLIQALVQLQTVTADNRWLEKAIRLIDFVIDHFSEPGTGFFFYTRESQRDVIFRKKEVYDGALPSGNSVMAENLYRLGMLLDRSDWKERAVGMVAALGSVIPKYPTSFGYWNSLFIEISSGTLEISVTGKDFLETYSQILKQFLPFRVMMGGDGTEKTYPLLAGKPSGNEPLIWFCRDYTCQQPVNSVKALMSLIDSGRGAK